MPRNSIGEYSTTPGDNTDIGGINIGEGMAPSDVNNAMRELLSQLKEFQTGAGGDTISPPVLIATTGTITNFTASGTATFSGAAIMSSSTTFNSRVREKVTVSATAATGTINYDVITQTVLYYTSNASGNWTLNVRGNSGSSINSIMDIGQALTLVFLVTQGSTAYYQSAFQVDGNAVTPKWQGGTAPTAGNASSIDSYTVTIVKTADATFTAFAALTKFA
jgi:hypothetical protein